MSVPAYPEYKDSGVPWLGDVPSHWKSNPLFALVRELDNRNTGMKEDNLLSLSYGQIKRKNIEDNDGLLPASFETYQIVERDDIIWRLTDLQNDQRSLRSGIVRERGIITAAYLATRPTGINPQFLAFLLRAYDLTKVFYSMGGGLRQSMKYSDVKWLPIILPSDKEQAAIAAFLDRETAMIDALVAEQQRLIALLKEKRQAVISHAVTKGLNPKAPMKDSGIEWLGEIPAHWEVKRVDRLMTFSSGKAHEPFIDDSGEHVYMSARFVSTQGESVKYCTENLSPAFPGDVVMVMSDLPNGRALARAYQIPNDGRSFAVNQRVCRLSDIKGCDRYFLHQLNRNEGLLWYNDGMNQTHLSNAAYCKLALCNPPVAEQLEIADYLDKLTALSDALQIEAQSAITLLQERRAALISAAVTGKIDVRGLTNPKQEAEAA